MTGGWHLAQINVGRLVAPPGDPRVDPFFVALNRINVLAEPAFTFRAQFSAPGPSLAPFDMNPDPWCVGRA